MAFALKIRGIPARDHALGWSVDNVTWWDMGALRAKYPCRTIEDETLYLDYVLVLTPAEAVGWNRRFVKELEARKSLDPAGWGRQIEELGRKLESTQAGLRWVIVEYYEWESGL